MHKNKNIEYATNLKLDLQYALEHDEELNISKRDIAALKWLINQAKKAEYYESALLQIGENQVEDPQKYAFLTLNEGKQIYEVFRNNK